MANKKTPKKQRPLSVTKNARKLYGTLPSGEKVYEWNPTEELLDEEALAKALFQCLKEGDVESFKEILSGHLDAKIKTRLAKKHGLSVRTMYEALSSQGNPSLKTIAKLIKLSCAS